MGSLERLQVGMGQGQAKNSVYFFLGEKSPEMIERNIWLPPMMP